MKDNIDWTPELEDEVDAVFINRVANEIKKSCVIPFSVPTERILEKIYQAAQWFWENVDEAAEERYYLIKNSDICKCDKLNRTIQLPPQIIGIFGCHKLQEDLRYGTMGDFSIERMLMSSYSMFGRAGIIGGGMGLSGGTGYTLTDVMMGLYEVDTFDQFLNPPLTYNYNKNSHKLVILGNLGHSDLLIQAWKRVRIQDLYNNYYFFRLCVCFCKQDLADILGVWEFKFPGGVTINVERFQATADDEITKIEEWAENNRATDFFMMPKII